jgi:hypothetical protein
MRSSLAIALLTGVTSASPLLGLPLDIGGLLSSLKPAAANDPRFKNFKPAGSGDGTSSLSYLDPLPSINQHLQCGHHAPASMP